MKKNILTVLIALGITFFTSSCKTSQNNLQSIEGNWTISQVDGNVIKTENPVSIEFGENNKLHASLGCNILNTTFTFDASNGAFTMNDGQRTLMMCPDMATEDAVLKALMEARSCKAIENGIGLYNEEGKLTLTLVK